LYGLLGIKRSATRAEIKAAYRSAARRLHPDTNASPAAQDDFQRIKAAYEVLVDSRLRKVYDNLGLIALGPKFSELHSYLGYGTEYAGENCSVRQGPGVRGRDVHLVLGLMLSEAAQGAYKILSYNAMSACEDCQGGREVGENVTAWCTTEHALLKSSRQTSTFPSTFPSTDLLEKPPFVPSVCVCVCVCVSLCSGRGRHVAVRELAVQVPAGVDSGQVLRVCGEGGAGRCGGAPGDLLVRLEVYPESNLERRGFDLHSVLAVDVFLAVLGGAVEVATVRGGRLLHVPPGSQPGDVLCLSGAGIAHTASGGGGTQRGDHYFTLTVRLPSAQQLCGPSLELLTQLAAV
ncbi:molecular chaperone, partial [Volvox carteri f. nagariensis]